MFRSVGAIRHLKHNIRSSILLTNRETVKLHHVVRNFSHLNKVSTSSLLNTRQIEFCRYQSTEAIAESPGITPTIDQASLPVIPEPPALPVVDSSIVETLAAGAEPTLASLGLGGYWPSGIFQHCMQFLHLDVGLPWWGAIMVATVTVRCILFPLVIISQRNSARLNNNMPQMQCIQQKLTEARQTGNSMEASRYSNELVLFMRDKEINPLKNMLVPLAQAPIFFSVFIGLRQMANCPIESMKTGGLSWFTDLTVSDPYFILPLVTSLTMLATIEIGTDGARLSATNSHMIKYVLRALPFIILPISINFPAAILVYWTYSNFFSLAQVSILKIPTIREYFKIDKMKHFAPHELPIKKKGFVEGFQDSWKNMKITKELEERRRVNDIYFEKAARGAVPKTYKFDPTKVKTLKAVQAKKAAQ